MGVTESVAGILLIIIGIIFFVSATPVMVSSVQTSAGTPLENETQTIKQFYSFYDLMFSVIPIFLIVFGIGLLWRG